ncbi:MAG: ABC transporter permease [Alphaproteobacteria bacterium]
MAETAARAGARAGPGEDAPASRGRAPLQPETDEPGYADFLATALRPFGWICLVLVGIICVAPVVIIAVGSISEGNPFNAFVASSAPWSRAFGSAHTLSAIGYSFLLSLRIPAGMLIAFVIAWYLARNDVFGKRTVMYALWLAFFLPILPATLGWVLMLDPNYGIINNLARTLPFVGGPVVDIFSLAGITWVHMTLSTIPIMVILIEPAQRFIDASYEEASTMAGAGTFTTLRRITIPLIAPTLLTAFIAGTIRSLEAFEVEQLLGLPADILVYATRIFHLLRVTPPDEPQAMAVSTLFIVILFVLVVLYRVMLQRAHMAATLTGKGARLLPRQRTRGSYVVSALLFVAVAIMTLLPFAMVVVSSFSTLFGFFDIPEPWTLEHWRAVIDDREFLSALRSSITTGLLVAVVGTLVYLALAWVLARNTFPGKSVFSLAIWMPWALPGVLLGTAFLSVFLNVPGLRVFYGTAVALVVVLVIQGLPFATHMFEASIAQISRELEESSLMSGAGRIETVRRVTAPLIAPMVATVFVLAFMSAVKDISATVLVATPSSMTLPLLMFGYATSGRPEVASVIGVVTVGIAMVMALLVTRIGDRAAFSR